MKIDPRPREVLRQQVTLLSEALSALEKLDETGDEHYSLSAVVLERAQAVQAQAVTLHGYGPHDLNET